MALNGSLPIITMRQPLAEARSTKKPAATGRLRPGGVGCDRGFSGTRREISRSAYFTYWRLSGSTSVSGWAIAETHRRRSEKAGGSSSRREPPPKVRRRASLTARGRSATIEPSLRRSRDLRPYGGATNSISVDESRFERPRGDPP